MIRLYKYIIIAAVSVLAGCSEKHDSATQVIAKVNDNEITVSEFNSHLNNQKTSSGIPLSGKNNLVLDELIRMNLFAGEAIKQNLDRTPEAVQRLEIAKKQVYADLFTDALLGMHKALDRENIEKFIGKNPWIFAPHRSVNLEILSINQPLEQPEAEKLNTFLHDFQKIKAFVQESNIAYSLRKRTIGIEDLQSDFYLNQNMPKVGNTIIQGNQNRWILTGIVSFADEPLGADETFEIAAKLYNAQLRKEAIDKEFKRLKLISNIEILNKNFEE